MLSQHEGLLYVNGKLGMVNVITLSRMNQSWREGNFHLKYFWAVFVAITALATSLMNALVVGAICKDPSRNLKTVPSNLLIASQAIADFFVGLIHDPLCSWWILTFSSTAAHVIEAVSSQFLGCIGFKCCRVVFRSLYCRLAAIEPPLRRHQEKSDHLVYCDMVLQLHIHGIPHCAQRA